MKKKFLAMGMAVALMVGGWGTYQALAGSAPKGWFPAGSHPQDYLMTRDTTIRYVGNASGTIKSKVISAQGFGTMMQTILADRYRNKRVRMSAYVKSKNVNDWAGLWLRVDGSGKDSLAFDNMQDRPIKGSQEWKQYHVVLDVPQEATEIAFGILMSGAGQVWIDKLTFEIVDKKVPLTGNIESKKLSETPQNPDFE